MNKKFFNRILMGVLFVASAISFGSCEDWEGEINNLQGQIDQIEASLEEIQAKVNAGERVADVKTNDEGVVLVMGDGSEFVIKHGKDGANGADGKNATVWTIGEDGFWYQDGVKTEFKAIGVDGAKGDKGDKGETGAAGAKGDKGDKGDKGETGATGAKGDTYYPATDGFWYVISGTDTTKVEPEMSWRAQCISAVVDGNVLRLSGVEGFEGEVEVQLGAQLGSVAFQALHYSSVLPLPTHEDPFLYVGNLLFDEDSKNGYAKNALASNNWVGNVVELPYRLNPGDAFIGDGLFVDMLAVNAFKETTRAGVEKIGAATGVFALTESVITSVEDGKFSVFAKLVDPERADFTGKDIAGNNKDAEGINDDLSKLTAALQVSQGTHTVVSDYIRVASEPTTAKLVVYNEKVADQKNLTPRLFSEAFINAGKVTVDGVANTEVKSYYAHAVLSGVKLDGTTPIVTVMRGKSIQLAGSATAPIQLVDAAGKLLSEQGFENIQYDVVLATSNVQDPNVDNTVQDSELYGSFNAANNTFTAASEAGAVGKKNVVRVNASIDGVLVASGYAVVQIVNEKAEELGDLTINVALADMAYSKTTAAGVELAGLTWAEATKQLYNVLNVAAEDFTKYYNDPVITITSDKQKLGQNGWYTDNNDKVTTWSANDGLGVDVTVNAAATGMNNIVTGVKVYNTVATDATVLGGNVIPAVGGKYTITIKYTKKNVANAIAYRDVIITHTITVKQDWVAYTLNSANAIGNVVTANGYLNTNGKLASNFDQHFSNAIKDGDKKSIFTGGAAYNANLGGGYLNIDATNTLASFEVVDPKCEDVKCTNVAHTPANAKGTHDYADRVAGEVVLNVALPAELKVEVKYSTVFANGDTKPYNYFVNFVNPLKAVAAEAETLFINEDEDAIQLDSLVKVFTKEKNVLIATGKYQNDPLTAEAAKLSIAKCDFAFDIVNDGGFGADYEQNAVFDIRKDANGKNELFFTNTGKTVFQKNYTATVKGTVTLSSSSTALYVVEVEIPVTLSK